jgi:plastocyanin
MRAATVAVFLLGSLGAPVFAHAQGGAEPADEDETKKELRQTKARLSQLRSALAEAQEFNHMSAEALTRAKRILDGEVTAPAPAISSAPELPDRPVAVAPGRGGAAAAAAAAAVRRRAAAAAAVEATGTVRGKVTIPGDEPVAYVFVENIRGPAVPGKVVIEQVNKQFQPTWAVVQRGKTVSFPNLDNIYHNVFSLSSGNAFDLGLYASGGEVKSHMFSEPGVVDIHCNIHPNMATSVLVVPNRYFAKVKADGTFELAGVPSGKRKIAAWAPGSKLSSDWVEVPTGANVDVNLRLESKSPGHTRKDGRPYGSYE